MTHSVLLLKLLLFISELLLLRFAELLGICNFLNYYYFYFMNLRLVSFSLDSCMYVCSWFAWQRFSRCPRMIALIRIRFFI